MKFFNQIDQYRMDKLFYIGPSKISRNDDKSKLSYALGATLYMPGTRKSIAEDIISNKYIELMSIAICTEDSISDKDRAGAFKNIVTVFSKLNKAVDDKILEEDNIPLIFVRVKDCENFKLLIDECENFRYLTGFIFPKVTSSNILEYMEILKEINEKFNRNFYAMPILETPEIIYKDTRINELMKIKYVLDKYKDNVLNVRIGATDFSNLFSVRRSYQQTIYDISVIENCISDIMNVLLREDSDYVVSGPVWEYFSNINYPSMDVNRVRKFGSKESSFGEFILKDKYVEGLIKETILDNVNGLIGKTIIHPTHISIVNAIQTVNREEYEDAISIIDNFENGVIKSNYNNKMNEPKPHIRWARKTINKSKVFGVLNEGYDYTNLC